MREGKLVEFLNASDQYGEFSSTWTYEVINDSTITYQGLRKYLNMNQPIETIFSTAIRIGTN